MVNLYDIIIINPIIGNYLFVSPVIHQSRMDMTWLSRKFSWLHGVVYVLVICVDLIVYNFSVSLLSSINKSITNKSVNKQHSVILILTDLFLYRTLLITVKISQFLFILLFESRNNFDSYSRAVHGISLMLRQTYMNSWVCRPITMLTARRIGLYGSKQAYSYWWRRFIALIHFSWMYEAFSMHICRRRT